MLKLRRFLFSEFRCKENYIEDTESVVDFFFDSCNLEYVLCSVNI